MSRNTSIGIFAAVALVLGFVSFSTIKNSPSVRGIAVQATAASTQAPSGSASTRVPTASMSGEAAVKSGPAGTAAGALTGVPGAPRSRVQVSDSTAAGSAATTVEGAFKPSDRLPGAPSGADRASRAADGDSLPAVQPPVSQPPADVVVHVAGAVRHPGVYHLRTGARNDDAVKAAGGLTSNANSASLNLAARAADGTQLYVKNQKEQPLGGAGEEPSIVPKGAPAAHKSATAATVKSAAPSRGAAAGRAAKLASPSEGRININTASDGELQRVRGVGPAMAQKIIAYREENHGFKTIEDLMQVSGVGSKTYAKLSPFFKLR